MKKGIGIVLLLLFTGGCTSTQFAAKTVDKLSVATQERERSQVQAFKSSVQISIELNEKLALATLTSAKNHLKVDVLRKIANKQDELVNTTTRQINELFTPVVKELERKLNIEKTKALRTGDRSGEFRTALKLSATLMAHVRNSASITDDVNRQFDDLREKLTSKIDKVYAAASNEISHEDSDWNALYGQLDADSTLFIQNMNAGYAEVNRYILRFSKAQETIIRELVPDFGSRLSMLVNKKIGDVQNKINTTAKTINSDLLQYAEELIADTASQAADNRDRQLNDLLDGGNVE